MLTEFKVKEKRRAFCGNAKMWCRVHESKVTASSYATGGFVCPAGCLAVSHSSGCSVCVTLGFSPAGTVCRKVKCKRSAVRLSTHHCSITDESRSC